MIAGERFPGVCVEDRAAEVAGVQGGGERGLVHDAAAGEVRDDRPRPEEGEFGGADESPCLVRERRVHRDDVGLGQELGEAAGAPHAKPGEPFVADVRIVADELHAKGTGATGDLAADAPDTDNAERLAHEFGAEEVGAFPAPLVHRLLGARQVAHEADHHAEEQLGHGDRIAGRRIDDGDAERCRGVDVHVVDAHAGAAHDAQSAGGPEQGAGDLRCAAADDRVVESDALEQGVGGERRRLVDGEVGNRREQGDALWVDVVGHENAKGHVAESLGCAGKVGHGVSLNLPASRRAHQSKVVHTSESHRSR